MIFWRKILWNTFMQIFIMLRHLVAEILPFKFDDYRVIRTGVSDLKLFLGGEHVSTQAQLFRPSTNTDRISRVWNFH